MKYSMWIKMVSTLLALILLSGLPVLSVWAAQDTPYITLQPQSPNYPEYSVAIYTVEASGKNLTATWYMDWQGKTYTISGLGGGMAALGSLCRRGLRPSPAGQQYLRIRL